LPVVRRPAAEAASLDYLEEVGRALGIDR